MPIPSPPLLAFATAARDAGVTIREGRRRDRRCVIPVGAYGAVDDGDG